jgi:hypothetical protein
MNLVSEEVYKKKYVLVSYPSIFEAEKVAFIISREFIDNSLEEQGIIIVTNNIIEDPTKKIIFTDYKSLAIYNNNVLLFDSLVDFNNIPEEKVKILIENNNIIMVFCSYGITRLNLERFKYYFPVSLLLYAKFFERPKKIVNLLHESNMSQKQEEVYKLYHNKNILDYPNDKELKYSQRICNIVFPQQHLLSIDTIQEVEVEVVMNSYKSKETLIKVNVEVSNDEKLEVKTRSSTKIKAKSLTKDKTSKSKKDPVRLNKKLTKVETKENEVTFDYNTFLINGQKIKDLITQLNLFRNLKHVIYTSYNKHFGVKMLSILLKELGFKVGSIDRLTKLEDQDNTIKSFNNDQISILVISQIPKSEIKNVSHVHFIDSLKFYNDLINKLYKVRFYTIPFSLYIHIYVCNSITYNTSSDVVLYKKFIIEKDENTVLWKRIKNNSLNITLGDQGGLYIP